MSERQPPSGDDVHDVVPRRRSLFRSLWGLLGLGAAAAVPAGLVACGGSSSDPPAPPAPGAPAPTPSPSPGGPATLGAHDLAYARHNISVPALAVALTTAAGGSSLLACAGRGNVSVHAPPLDNKGNTFTQVGSAQTYTLWPSSGTALYFCASATGGSGHNIGVSKPALDETTLSVVEIRGASVLRDVRWREVLAGSPVTSHSVVTTGPALLVAWWWGDAGVDGEKTAVPDNGFTVIHSVLGAGELVQCAVAVRRVEAAGTYNVTWTATPLQGAQLWIAAVQAA